MRVYRSFPPVAPKTTAVMLKRFENDQTVAPAEKEFNEAQEIEAAFDRDFDGLDAT
jgi:hypothetical protein